MFLVVLPCWTIIYKCVYSFETNSKHCFLQLHLFDWLLIWFFMITHSSFRFLIKIPFFLLLHPCFLLPCSVFMFSFFNNGLAVMSVGGEKERRIIGERDGCKDKGWNVLLAHSLFYYPFIITNNKQIVCMKSI